MICKYCPSDTYQKTYVKVPLNRKQREAIVALERLNVAINDVIQFLHQREYYRIAYNIVQSIDDDVFGLVNNYTPPSNP